ncbi:MAG: hypothetical protein A2Y33_10035 [Spirochaetes bacterium GWF1_51_8]|nr:MAG: hypothetical protein A2Y33_10035 [Spirochaetes bacterium GWF1_51_8]
MAERFLYGYKKTRTRLSVAVVFPNSYRLGMSNLGFQTVYHMVQSHQDISCERVFYEGAGRVPVSVENGRQLSEFDIVIFSVSFETDLIHCFSMLMMSGIELNPSHRKKPYIAAGGIVSVFGAKYIREFADILACGDAPLFIPAILENGLNAKSKDEFLSGLTGIDGMYLHPDIPLGNMPYVRDTEWRFPAHTVILSDETEFADRGLIEISRSCLYRCAFCLVSRVYGEYGYLPKERILETAEKYKGLTARLGLVAATSTNHPQFGEIVDELNSGGFSLSFSAFRIEPLDNELLKKVIDNENKTLVIAPETVSPRLKKLIHKDIPESIILERVRAASLYGIKRIKLYFLIGLPGETYDDLDEIVRLVTAIRGESSVNVKQSGFLPEMIVDINPLVPKPFTDFSESPIEDEKPLRKKTIYLKNRLRSLGRVFVYGESPKNSHLQYRISRGLMDTAEMIRLAGNE